MAEADGVKKIAGGTEAESGKKLSKAEIQAANEKAIDARKAAQLAKINEQLASALTAKTKNEEIINNANKNSGEIKHVYNGMYTSPEVKIKNAKARMTYLEHQKNMIEHPGLEEESVNAENKIKVAKKEEQQNNIKNEIQSGFEKVEIVQDDLKTPEKYPKEYAKIPNVSDFKEASGDNPFKDKT